MAKRKSVDTSLGEITLRKYEKPSGEYAGEGEKRELVRKLCLSLGLLQPGDSRDVVVDVFYVILDAGKPLRSVEVEQKVIEFRKGMGLELLGVASSNIRRQLLRLRDLFLVEKEGNFYHLKENEKLISLFEEHLEKYYIRSIISRVKDYLRKTDEVFSKEKTEDE